MATRPGTQAARSASITNTRKITKAMELVASARLRRAQARIEAMRPYADRMLELMAGTARASASVRGLPLLQRRDVATRRRSCRVTGDRGLAGAFNAQVLRRALALQRRARRDRASTCAGLPSAGRAISTLRFRRYELDRAVGRLQRQPARTRDAQAIAHRLAELYVERRGRPRRARLQPLRLARSCSR